MKKLVCISILLFTFVLIGCLSHTAAEQKENVAAVSDTTSLEPVVWTAPDSTHIPTDLLGELITYGRDLIAHTAYYIGPEGTVNKNLKNKMNCTNCHLDNGTRPFGNNFFLSHKIYPQYRARENKVLSLADRVNNCIERPHSGTPLKLESKEMLAILCYIKWVGQNYDPKINSGAGFKHIDNHLEASSQRGESVYKKNCVTCHQSDGFGKMKPDGSTYEYPPLWGPQSYQEGSSMHRVLKAASFIKYNMPNNLVNWEKPLLSDQEALDVAAFINDGSIHPRPKPKKTIVSYPNVKTKPVDYFKGPYLDNFSEKQHTFGPWDAIVSYYQEKGIKLN